MKDDWLERDREDSFSSGVEVGIEQERQRIQKILKEIHDILDNLNGEKGNYCLFCDADSYNGKDGIEHKDRCIILKLREWMKGE